jgi:hypothetical protein
MFFASAFVRSSRFFVSSLVRKRHGVEKNDPVSHPVVHAPQ